MMQASFRYGLWVALLALSFCAHAASGRVAPSFDCTNAATPVEKAICASPELAALDARLDRAYRSFLGRLPVASRADARRMQHIWLQERDRVCENRIAFYGMSGRDANIAFPPPDTAEPAVVHPLSLQGCLARDYREALGAIDRGALLARMFIDRHRSVYALHVGTWPALRIRKPDAAEIAAARNEYECTDCARATLDLADGAGRSGEPIATIVHGASPYAGGYLIRELRIYLPVSGRPLFAYVAYDDMDTGGNCPAGADMSLHFVARGAHGIVPYAAPDLQDSTVLLAHDPGACGDQPAGMLDWRVEHGHLVFTEWSSNSFYYWSVFPAISNQTVDPLAHTVTTHDALQQDLHAYRGTSYAQLYDSALKAAGGDFVIDAGPSCAAVQRALYQYMAVKDLAIAHMINQSQALFIVHHLALTGRYPDAMRAARPLARAMLFYLGKIRAVAHWQDRLDKAAAQFPEPNQHYFMDDVNWTTSPFVTTGFYTDHACLAHARSPAVSQSVEDWIYNFWYRRLKDGTLEDVEGILQQVVASRRQSARTSIPH